MLVSIFANDRGFPVDVNSSLLTSYAGIRKGQAEAFFHALPYGKYAVSVLHDEDLDGKMATNFFGAPQEGFCFSGHPSYRFGRPHFDDTSFLLISTDRELELVMRYETGRDERQKSARHKIFSTAQ